MRLPLDATTRVATRAELFETRELLRELGERHDLRGRRDPRAGRARDGRVPRDEVLDRLRELCTRRLDAVEFVRVFLDARPVDADPTGANPTGADPAEPGDPGDGEVVVQVVGLSASGEVDVLGYDAGDAGSRDFWRRHLATLRARGLHRLRVLESGEHGEIEAALADVFPAARWRPAADPPPWVPSPLRPPEPGRP